MMFASMQSLFKKVRDLERRVHELELHTKLTKVVPGVGIVSTKTKDVEDD